MERDDLDPDGSRSLGECAQVIHEVQTSVLEIIAFWALVLTVQTRQALEAKENEF